jgi:hypothetical protein
MANNKKCFMNADRPCDLTCKAAFEVDDPVDNVDCYFIWLSLALGESLYEVRKVMEGFGGFGFPPMPGGMSAPDNNDPHKDNKGEFPNN